MYNFVYVDCIHNEIHLFPFHKRPAKSDIHFLAKELSSTPSLSFSTYDFMEIRDDKTTILLKKMGIDETLTRTMHCSEVFNSPRLDDSEDKLLTFAFERYQEFTLNRRVLSFGIFEHEELDFDEMRSHVDWHLRVSAPEKILEQINGSSNKFWKKLNEFVKRERKTSRLEMPYVSEVSKYIPKHKGIRVDAELVTVIAKWRQTKGVYTFNRLLADEASEAEFADADGPDLLSHLPEWCLYIAPDHPSLPLCGFFAHIDKKENGQFVLKLLIGPDLKDVKAIAYDIWTTYSMPLIRGRSLKESICSWLDTEGLESAGYKREVLSFLVSMVVMLAVREPEILIVNPKKTVPAGTSGLRSVSVHKMAASRPNVVDVQEYRLGKTVKPNEVPVLLIVNKDPSASANNIPDENAEKRRMAPHLRKGHWRGVWIGPRGSPERKVAKVWINPSFVNSDEVEKKPSTIHPVGSF